MTADAPRAAHTGAAVRWLGCSDAAVLTENARRMLLAHAAVAIRQRGAFLVVLSGGHTPRELYRALLHADTDWSRWTVYFGDERCLPVDHPQRNSRMAADVWLDHVAIPRARIHEIAAERGAAVATQAYRDTLRPVPLFDLVLLGLGADGHVAGLFPGHARDADGEDRDVLAVLDAPEPFPQRVTMSAARLGRTRAALMLVAGESKRDAVHRWRRGEDIPAAAIRPPGGIEVLVESALLRDPDGTTG